MKAIPLLVYLTLIPLSIPQQPKAPEKDHSSPQRTHPEGTTIPGLPFWTISNINSVSAWYGVNGTQEWNPISVSSGLTFPRQTATAVYTAGLMWGGMFSDGLSPQLRVNGQSYNVGTQRGAILGTRTGIAEDPDAPDVRIWRIRRDYSTADLTIDAAEINNIPPDQVTEAQIQAVRDQYATDWTEWPAQKGAPFYDSDHDGIYLPEFMNGEPVLYPDADEPGLVDADQVLWYVCNDLTVQPWTNVQSGIEEQTTIWGYNQSNALGNTTFKRFRLIYKGTALTEENASIENMYIAQWSDPDLGDFGDDYAGCDTTLSLGYFYNGIATDANYADFGLPPPAGGYDILQGPVVLTGNPADTAIFDFRKVAGARNLPATSFLFYAAGGSYSDPPFNASGGIQWYQTLRGLPPTPQGPPDPTPPTDPFTGQPAGSFWLYAGSDGVSAPDPANPNGWVDGIINPPGDRHILLSSGPFSLALNDTAETIIATVLGIGTSYLQSVEVMKSNDREIQEFYNTLAGIVTSIDDHQEPLPSSTSLMQNFPNPFNGISNFEFQISNLSHVSLKIYDLLGREVTTLANEKLGPGTYTRQWDASGMASGVYFYRLTTGEYRQTKKLLLLR